METGSHASQEVHDAQTGCIITCAVLQALYQAVKGAVCHVPQTSLIEAIEGQPLEALRGSAGNLHTVISEQGAQETARTGQCAQNEC